ncbi:hypothetical protein HWV62_8066, partial [Athelia sp. TMB]
MTPTECHRWYMVGPVLNVLQLMVSQLVLGVSYEYQWRICHALGVAPGYGVWIHYLFRVVFTFVLTVMSFVYLAKYYFSRKASMVWDVIEMYDLMFFDGLGYFLLLTAVNVFSMVLYMSESPTQ